MTTWAELLKGRKPIASMRNSAHMLECVKKVQEKYPTAEIRPIDGKWHIISGYGPLSNPHNSHYECWIEAREALSESD